MAAIPMLSAWAGLVALFAIALPLGATLLWTVERLLDLHLRLTPAERALASFYAAGALLFVIASIPIPLFYSWVIVVVLVVGAVVWIARTVSDRARHLTEVWKWLSSPAAAVLIVGSLGLLALYLVTIGQVSFGNADDGAFHSLLTTVLLQSHTAPWTLAPYVPAGVEYPAGSPVWEALPPILFGWPVTASPVLLPTLFLSFTPAAAYCWGVRLAGIASPIASRVGLLFAAFFGLVASWPRLYVGGSYDFLFALPLLLLFLGWMPRLILDPVPSWREAVVIGLGIGFVGVVSASIGLEFALLIGAAFLVRAWKSPAELGRLAARYTAIVALGVLVLIRSFASFIVWFGYPGHLLTSVGSSTAPATSGFPFPAYRYVTGELDPFVLWAYKDSPIPYLSIEIGGLLIVGFVLLALALRHPSGRVGRTLNRDLVQTLSIAMVATFLLLTFLLLVGYFGGPLAPISSITSVEELSYPLFVTFEGVALLPMLASLTYLSSRRAAVASPPREGTARRWTSRSNRGVAPARSRTRALVTVLAVVALVQPLALGAFAMTSSVPTFLYNHVEEVANVTRADISALTWAGSRLPRCSRVLVTVGSAAEYLPEYAAVHLVSDAGYGANLSYVHLVAGLTHGNYSGSERQDLIELTVTEVFVTGQNNHAFLPFLPQPLENSTDFVTLYHQSDAYIFAFLPVIQTSGCQD